MNVVVIAIGQSLRGDDAVGLEAVRLWSESYPATAARPDVRVEFGGLPGLGLLDLLGGAGAALIVDAVRSNSTAGTIHRLNPDELSAFDSGAQSAHGFGVAETLALASQLELPIQHVSIRIIGIEAGQMDLGAALSPAVSAILPSAAAAIETELQTLLANP